MKNLKKEYLSNQPPKGMYDWKPDEYQIRKYIFDTWRKVCLSYGYQEYLTPLLESAEIYRAKSGDAGGIELMSIKDRAGRELAIRPEMTPSVTRMVSQIYESSPKPIRLFSIANFVRNEKPQRGRNREFWQLNYDIFGSDSIDADIEILLIALDIMREFKATPEMFTLKVSSRKILDYFLTQVCNVEQEQIPAVARVMDKWGKLQPDGREAMLAECGQRDIYEKLGQFMSAGSPERVIELFGQISESEGYREVQTVVEKLNSLGFTNAIFDPGVVRGFDYYDGMIFEVFDNNPENRKAMFGGGRYNGLADLFGGANFSAVGCAPGDETTRLFLESWNLLQELPDINSQTLYLPLIDQQLDGECRKLAQLLRNDGYRVESGLEVQGLGKAFSYADKKGYQGVVIFGSNEAAERIYKIKNLASGEETVYNIY